MDKVIEAPDEADARAQASGAGLMVETLTTAAPAAAPAPYAVRVLTTVVEHAHGGNAVIQSKLETMLNDMASQGWEFVAVQAVPTKTLAGSGGRGRISGEDVAADVALVVFRRARGGHSPPRAEATGR